MCHGVCASDVTGLACGASDVMSRNVKTASPKSCRLTIHLKKKVGKSLLHVKYRAALSYHGVKGKKSDRKARV